MVLHILKSKLTEDQFEINFKDFDNGVYFIRISNDKGIWQGRIIK